MQLANFMPVLINHRPLCHSPRYFLYHTKPVHVPLQLTLNLLFFFKKKLGKKQGKLPKN